MQQAGNKRSTLFDPHEHPGLAKRYRRAVNWIYVASFGLVGAPGYTIYFLNAPLPTTGLQQQFLHNCGTCLRRYNDLQTFDGISGSVYVVTVLLFFVISMIAFLYLLWMYVSAWRASGSHLRLHRAQATLALWLWLVPVALVFVIVFMPTNLSETIYPGNAQVLLGWGYPLLAAASAPLLALSLMQLSVVLLKLFSQGLRATPRSDKR